MASLHMILSQLDKVEEMFKLSIQVAENSKEKLSKSLDQTQTVFMWQNNLLKFYMENDIEKAVDFAKELIDE
jgi:HEPN domain-containing protein